VLIGPVCGGRFGSVQLAADVHRLLADVKKLWYVIKCEVASDCTLDAGIIRGLLFIGQVGIHLNRQHLAAESRRSRLRDRR